MTVVIRHCDCLKGTVTRVRDMLKAEGFNVQMQVTYMPGTLQVNTDTGKTVWSWALWRRQVPDQKTLAAMVRKAQDGPIV